MYIFFSLGQLRSIDSSQLLLASLNKLVAANQPESFQIIAKHELGGEKRQLLLCKGVYCYKYMESWKQFANHRLPSKEVFYGMLSDEPISEEEYVHLQNV